MESKLINLINYVNNYFVERVLLDKDFQTKLNEAALKINYYFEAKEKFEGSSLSLYVQLFNEEGLVSYENTFDAPYDPSFKIEQQKEDFYYGRCLGEMKGLINIELNNLIKAIDF